jgi:hypothetical protein
MQEILFNEMKSQAKGMNKTSGNNKLSQQIEWS